MLIRCKADCSMCSNQLMSYIAPYEHNWLGKQHSRCEKHGQPRLGCMSNIKASAAMIQRSIYNAVLRTGSKNELQLQDSVDF